MNGWGVEGTGVDVEGSRASNFHSLGEETQEENKLVRGNEELEGQTPHCLLF